MTSMASKSIDEIAPVMRHRRIVIGTKILKSKTTIAATVKINLFYLNTTHHIVTYIYIYIIHCKYITV